MIFYLNPPRTTSIIHVTPNDFYCTLTVFSYVLVPYASRKVERYHSNNDAGTAHAHSNFGRGNNGNYTYQPPKHLRYVDFLTNLTNHLFTIRNITLIFIPITTHSKLIPTPSRSFPYIWRA